MKLFKKLAKIYSGSNEEEPMRQYIKRWIKSCVSNVEVTEDKFGNLYIVKGYSDSYPCVVAHLDQVQSPYPEDIKIVETQDLIFSYSRSKKAQCGLGADDKCGIWIALKMLKKYDTIKVAFFPCEEIGCQGSRQADMSFFEDVRFVIEPDRRGAKDLITQIGFMDLCSEEFLEAIGYGDFGYEPTTGMMTDIEELKCKGLKVSCINLSCGYYAPHTDHEYVVKEDMINALNFVDHIIETCQVTYPHEAKSAWVDDYGFNDRLYNVYGCWDDYGWDYGQSKKRSKKQRSKGSGKSFISEDNYLEEYDSQCYDAEALIQLELEDNPGLTAKEFYDNYGKELDLLEFETIESLIKEAKGEAEAKDFVTFNSNEV